MRRITALLAIVTLLPAGVALAAKHKARKTSGQIYVSLIHSGKGGLFYADGDFKDKVLGSGAIIYRVKATTGPAPGTVLIKSPKVTIYTAKGSMTGTGQAQQTSTGATTATLSKGTFKLTKGTGAYKGHTFRGTFGGTLADGIYHFTYKGTYR